MGQVDGYHGSALVELTAGGQMTMPQHDSKMTASGLHVLGVVVSIPVDVTENL